MPDFTARSFPDRSAVKSELAALAKIADKTGLVLPAVFDFRFSEKDPARWLDGQTDDFKCYWRSRDGKFEIAGTGIAFKPESNGFTNLVDTAARLCDHLPNSPAFIYAGSFTGTPGSGAHWHDYPGELCYIPRLSVFRDGDAVFKRLVVPVGPDADLNRLADVFEILDQSPDISRENIGSEALPDLKTVKHSPVAEDWRRNIQICLQKIRSGELEKVVLARRTDYEFESAVDPALLLRKLRELHPRSYTFLVQTRPGNAFISVTPERLYKKRGLAVQIDALSSTANRGETTEDDRRMERFLKHDTKEKLEHAYVVDGIRNSIAPLCTSTPVSGETTVLKLESIQHLKTPIRANLRKKTTDGGILAALHPTPAVGGTPRSVALETIGRFELFDRGWYAAPVGLFSREQTEFAVAIRSVLVRDRTVSVFTGAGIVEGSDPETEWRELDKKNVLTPLLGRQVAP
jgi:menaquinone-specific isochorismate synthase